MNRVRSFGFLVLFASVLSAQGVAQQPGRGQMPNINPMQLFEQLVRHSDSLVTEINLSRANGFQIPPAVLRQLVEQAGWARSFYGALLFDRAHGPDFLVGKLANDFRMEAIRLYEFWSRVRRPGPNLTNQFRRTNYAYYNALSATYFYIEALRRAFIVQGCPFNPGDRGLLIRRLTLLETIAFQVRELMHLVRHEPMFGFPRARYCVECTYGPFRVNIQDPRPQPIVPFPYFAGGQPQVPAIDFREHPQGFNPIYNPNSWNQRWNYIDQGYLNPGGSQLPNATYSTPNGLPPSGAGAPGSGIGEQMPPYPLPQTQPGNQGTPGTSGLPVPPPPQGGGQPAPQPVYPPGSVGPFPQPGSQGQGQPMPPQSQPVPPPPQYPPPGSQGQGQPVPPSQYPPGSQPQYPPGSIGPAPQPQPGSQPQYPPGSLGPAQPAPQGQGPQPQPGSQPQYPPGSIGPAAPQPQGGQTQQQQPAPNPYPPQQIPQGGDVSPGRGIEF